MSRPTAIDGTPYRPRATTSGSPEAPLNRLKNRARGMLKSSSMPRQDKDLIRAALARLKELSGEIGQAFIRENPDEAARLEGHRTEVMSLLSLMLDQAQEKAAAAKHPGALMASRPRG